MGAADNNESLDFIRQKVAQDTEAGLHGGRVVTRFPPEPNGFLHIGHAKSICLNFGIAEEFAGRATGEARCHLRFDDTNPTKEEQRYIDAIRADIRWLGFDWGEHEYYASDYFPQLYLWGQELIRHGHAYVDDQTADEIRATRGTLTAPGTGSPYRDRPAEESLDLFERMKHGEFGDGQRTLRAKIDMASPNLNLRDPVMYRILRAEHPRTGSDWCIYPMYDWAHGQSDWIEGITHSLCTLEFEAHRPLYDWFIDTLMSIGCHPRGGEATGIDRGDRPHQTEFNRLNLAYTVVTKRKLRALVDEDIVHGWDDPRMPTLSAMRRRGYPPEAIKAFCRGVSLSKRDQLIDMARLEHAIREELNRTARRLMAVLDPIKVVVTNYPEGQVEHMTAVNNPEDPEAGTRQVPFSRELYIERDDFMEDPPRKFFRLAPGREVRLRYAYWVTCTEVIKDADGHVTEIHCTYDPETRGGESPPDGRKVKGTLHWVSAEHALTTEVRLYDRLFNVEEPNRTAEGDDWHDTLHDGSLSLRTNCRIEPAARELPPGATCQFERQGYFCVDPASSPDALIFNRTVTLRDSWAKMQKSK